MSRSTSARCQRCGALIRPVGLRMEDHTLTVWEDVTGAVECEGMFDEWHVPFGQPMDQP